MERFGCVHDLFALFSFHHYLLYTKFFKLCDIFNFFILYTVMNSFLADRQDNAVSTYTIAATPGCAGDHDLAVIPRFSSSAFTWVHAPDNSCAMTAPLFLRLTRAPGGKLAHTGQSLGDASCLIQLDDDTMIRSHNRLNIQCRGKRRPADR